MSPFLPSKLNCDIFHLDWVGPARWEHDCPSVIPPCENLPENLFSHEFHLLLRQRHHENSPLSSTVPWRTLCLSSASRCFQRWHQMCRRQRCWRSPHKDRTARRETAPCCEWSLAFPQNTRSVMTEKRRRLALSHRNTEDTRFRRILCDDCSLMGLTGTLLRW